ncbi:hypothetical protein K1T71_013048 [Dendrolimus kikuchii]|uniref:Uncharacterized protein n=1 Tax=Dendrolimus kikuchii TaxID=765133 RepID=A0ACC1CIT8_9NEOP|nr:hypothetical protein K1T71_013048 [Dendrolimus kikuchii]
MSRSLISFGDDMSTVLGMEPEDEEYIILSTEDEIELSTYKKELEGLQRLDATFLEPVDSPEFEAWLDVIEPHSAGILLPHKAVQKLEANPILQSQYIKFVPGVLSYKDFWERYLFRVTLLQHRLGALSRYPPIEETISDPVVAQLPLLNPIEQFQITISAHKCSTEDFANDAELTVEQQTLLLEEYEKVIATKNQTKQRSAKDVAKNNTIKNVDKRNAQARDKMNNKPVDKNKNGRSPKAGGKTDVCGNSLVEDHFDDKEVKDDASPNSDEIWEKDFEVDDVVQKG